MDMCIVIINGPNLNLLGRRETNVYGTQSMEQVLLDIQRAYPDLHLIYKQSNHEGDLIDWLQEYGMPASSMYGEDMLESNLRPIQGIILNAGGYTHTSVALRDAVAACQVPVVELHISNIYQREEFRRVSLLTDVATHAVIGKGVAGYQQAVAWILQEEYTLQKHTSR